MKGKMVLGGVDKEGIKIYYQKKKEKRIFFYLSIMGAVFLYSLITGDWGVALAGLMFSTITISLDSATQFESGGATYNDICRLSDTHFAIAFADADDNNRGKVIIGTLSGTTITITQDTAVTFEGGTTEYISIDTLDSTHVIISYKDVTDTNKGKCVVCSVSGVTPTIGAISVFKDAVITDDTSVTALDSTYFAIFYTSNFDGLAVVGSVSGTTITIGAEQTAPEDKPFNSLSSDKLSTTKIVLGYSYSFGTSRTVTIVATVDTGAKTISWGSQNQLAAVNYTNLSLSCFDDIYFVMTYYTASNGYVRASSVSGTTITMGSHVSFNAAVTSNVSICTMDTTHFVVAYKDEGNSNKGTVRGGSISGTTITLDGDGEILFESDNTTNIAICKMLSNYFIIPFKDEG